MSLFQLDPHSIAARTRAAHDSSPLPTLATSLLRGAIGFTLLSIAGFAPWPMYDLWFHGGSEALLYLTCTAVFIGLSGPLLHRLIIGPGSLPRFYKLFALAFIAYAAVWVALWMTLRFGIGEILGLLGGALAMSTILALAFDAWRSLIPSVLAIFILNTLGYYAGGWIEGKL